MIRDGGVRELAFAAACRVWLWMAGRDVVVLEHLARDSNRRRFDLVECVERFDSVVRVVARRGRDEQWYRDVAANEIAYVTSADIRRVRAIPRLLTRTESDLRLDELNRGRTTRSPADDPLVADFTLHWTAG